MTDMERHPREAQPAPAVTPLSDIIVKPKGSAGRGTTLLFALAAGIAIGGLAFAAGRLTAPAVAVTNGRGAGQLAGDGQLPGNGQPFAGRDGFGGITLNGTVSAISADSITLTLAGGTDVTIPLDASTTYHAATSAAAGVVTVGSEVSVTPGARVASGATPNPNETPNPNRSPGAFPRLGFGPASDVTVIEK